LLKQKTCPVTLHIGFSILKIQGRQPGYWRNGEKQMALRESHKFVATINGDTLTFETGKLAEQAGGAVTVKYGDTVMFAVATMSKETREMDFFPLSVDYEEKCMLQGVSLVAFSVAKDDPPNRQFSLGV
jgi:polyribonucleotide nucleotidyltransferase